MASFLEALASENESLFAAAGAAQVEAVESFGDLPLVVVGKELFGLEGIFSAAMVAGIITSIGGWWWLRRVLVIPEPALVSDPAVFPVRTVRQPVDSIGQ